MGSKARSSAEEDTAVITCAWSRPETRPDRDAEGPQRRASLATLKPSRPTTPPQTQPAWMRITR
jgi:hypothetical protein